jgi:hypothetical protein
MWTDSARYLKVERPLGVRSLLNAMFLFKWVPYNDLMKYQHPTRSRQSGTGAELGLIWDMARRAVDEQEICTFFNLNRQKKIPGSGAFLTPGSGRVKNQDPDPR